MGRHKDSSLYSLGPTSLAGHRQCGCFSISLSPGLPPVLSADRMASCRGHTVTAANLHA